MSAGSPSRRRSAAAAALFALAVFGAGVAAPTLAQEAATLPADVRTFVERRDGCDHFRGEEPYDAARRAEIEEALKDLCTGSDAELARLRRAYSADAAVMRALADYEDRIE